MFWVHVYIYWYDVMYLFKFFSTYHTCSTNHIWGCSNCKDFIIWAMRRSLGIFFGRVERAIYCDVIGGGAKKKSIVYFYFIYMTYTTLILVSNSKAKTKSRCSIFFPTTSLKAVVGCLPLLMLLSASSSRLFLHCNLIIFKSDYSEIFFIS